MAKIRLYSCHIIFMNKSCSDIYISLSNLLKNIVKHNSNCFKMYFYEFWKFDKIIWKGQFSLAHSGSNAEIPRYFKVKLLPLNFGFKDVDILSIESLSPKSLYSWKFKLYFKVYKILILLFNWQSWYRNIL